MKLFRNWKVPPIIKSKGNHHNTDLYLRNADPISINDYPDALYVMDSNGEIVKTNEKFDLLFKGEERLISRPKEWLPKNQYEEMKKFQSRAFSGETVHYEMQAVLDENNRYHFSITHIPLYEGPLIVAIYGVVRDLSEQRELLHQYNRLKVNQTLTEQIPGLAIVEYRIDTNVYYYSDQVSKLLGIPKMNVKQMGRDEFRNLIHKEDRPLFSQHVERIFDDPDFFEYESIIRAKHRLNGWLQLLVKVGKSSDLNTITWVLFDLSERSKMQEDINKDREILEKICNVSDSVVLEYSYHTNTYRSLTPGFAKIFSISDEHINTNSQFWDRLVHPDDLSILLKARENLKHENPKSILYRIFVNKEIKWIQDNYFPLFDAHHNVIGFQTIIKDVTDLKRRQEEIIKLSRIDKVTNIPNREAITETVDSLLEKGESFSLFSICFNRIDEINQTLGFEIGDAWRTATTDAVIRVLPKDAYLGSLYGDHLLVISPNKLDDLHAKKFASNFLNISKEMIRVQNYEFQARISIGISRYPEDASTSSDLIRCAETAKFRAQKREGSLSKLYASNMDIEALRQFELLRDMSRAIHNSEFYLMYQPKVDSWTGQVIGAEALMRWTHPTWGAISPTEFIPLAEENGLYIPLTNWLIEDVCRYLKSIDYSLPISLNIPPKFFLKQGYLNSFVDALSRYNVPKFKLEVEISETTLLEDENFMSAAFEALNDIGVAVTFDDFGVGYSSLAYLQMYNVQTIKVDRKFATRIHDNPKSQAIVRSILLLAKEFEMSVVIEGVETIDELFTVRELGCKIIQGFLFSPPVLPSELETIIEKRYLNAVEETVTTLRQASSYIPAAITITHIRGKQIDVGIAPILILHRKFQTLGFYSSIRLPVDGSVRLVILLSDEKEHIPIHITRSAELANGLYQYEATYKPSLAIDQRFSELEHQKTKGFTTSEVQNMLNNS